MAEDNRVRLLAAGFRYGDKESAMARSYCCSTLGHSRLNTPYFFNEAGSGWEGERIRQNRE